MASQMQDPRAGLRVDMGGAFAGSVRADAFMQQMIADSQGAVLGYEILSQEEISQLDEETIGRVRASDAGWSYSASASANASESYKQQAKVDAKRGATSYESEVTHRSMRSYWKVRIRADIAKYRAPDEEGRPKIVIALPHTRASSYVVGDGRVDADEVARAVRARLSDTLTQAKRFIVLDREFGDELQAEIDHINSGNVRLQDTARIGQQLATDLILIPTIERFEYPRSVRNLRMSDRQVSSYSGGGRITLRLINASTGEVVMSDSFDHQLASTGPSTLPREVNGRSMATAMMDSLSGQIGTAIVSEIFPVSVVSVEGDQVVLSQGGDLLQVGQRWQAVLMGEALTDPQTGRSLGRAESSCCTIHIDRVASQTSYGTIEGVANFGVGGFKPGMIELRQKAAPQKASAPATGGGAAAAASRKAAVPKPSAPEEDPNW